MAVPTAPSTPWPNNPLDTFSTIIKEARAECSGLFLLFLGQVLNLVDDVLILALGFEVNRKTADGSENTTYAASPE